MSDEELVEELRRDGVEGMSFGLAGEIERREGFDLADYDPELAAEFEAVMAVRRQQMQPTIDAIARITKQINFPTFPKMPVPKMPVPKMPGLVIEPYDFPEIDPPMLGNPVVGAVNDLASTTEAALSSIEGRLAEVERHTSDTADAGAVGLEQNAHGQRWVTWQTVLTGLSVIVAIVAVIIAVRS